MVIIEPVMYDAAGESRKAAARPNSSGSAKRRSGIPAVALPVALGCRCRFPDPGQALSPVNTRSYRVRARAFQSVAGSISHKPSPWNTCAANKR